MTSKFNTGFRRLTLLACFVALSAFTSSCARHTAAPVPKPPMVVMVRPAPPLAPKRVGPPPLAFPALYTGPISSLQFYPDGRRLALGYGSDSAVTVWNLETGRLDWQRHVDGTNGGPMIMDPKGRFLIVESGDMDSGLHFVACTPDGKLLSRFPGHAATAYDWGDYIPFIWLNASGRTLFMDGTRERLYNGRNNVVRQINTYDTRTWRQTNHALVASASPLPYASSGQAIYGELPFQPSRFISERGIPRGNWWKREANPPFDDAYTASWKNFYARASGDSISKGCVEVWDMRRKKKIWLAPLKNQSVRAAAVSPDGQLLAIGTVQGYVFFWQLQTGRLLARKRYSGFIDCLAFSPNSRVLAADCGTEQIDDGVKLLDCVSYKPLAALSVAFPENSEEKDWTLNHPDWFAALPDQSYIASDSVVKKIRMPGKARDAAFIRRFHRPQRVRAALRKCYTGL